MGFPMTVKRVIDRNHLNDETCGLHDFAMLRDDVVRLGDDTRTLARADALREAREAVAAVSGELDGNPWDGTRVVIAREDALAAIDALPSGTSS